MRIFSLILLVSLIGCSQQQEASTFEKPVAEELPLIAEEGSKITGRTFSTLSSNLQQALKDSGVSYALSYCNVEAMPLTDSLSENFGVDIRRASHMPRNQENRADSLELVTIQNYINTLKAGGELKPYTYRTGTGAVFHAPIRIAGQLCLNCHGRPGDDISEKDMEIINKLYPKDEATGFALRELRGIWSVSFPKAYVDSLNQIIPNNKE